MKLKRFWKTNEEKETEKRRSERYDNHFLNKQSWQEDAETVLTKLLKEFPKQFGNYSYIKNDPQYWSSILAGSGRRQTTLKYFPETGFLKAYSADPSYERGIGKRDFKLTSMKSIARDLVNAMCDSKYGIDKIIQNYRRNEILNELKSKTKIDVKKEILNYRKNKISY